MTRVIFGVMALLFSIAPAGAARQDSMNAATHLHPFFFDVLHVDGESLIDQPLQQRKQVLAELAPSELLLPTLSTTDASAAEQFARAALDAGHEGVMVKALYSPYQAGRRGATWRKVKPVHTLDLVVLAAEWGHGRRTGRLSNLHLGARTADGSFAMADATREATAAGRPGRSPARSGGSW